jgi:mono/diheme cytochrome c family protein
MRFAWLLVGAFLVLSCRGREERTIGPTTAKVTVPSDPESGEPERVGPAEAGGGDPARGKAVYEASCVSCHGPDGAGRTPMGQMMRAGNLTDAAVHARLSDGQMAAVVKNGKGRMPSFDLADEQLRDVVAYVRSLKR